MVTPTLTETLVSQVAIVPSATASRTPRPTNTPMPTSTDTVEPSETPTHTPSATLTATATSSPPSTATTEPTATVTQSSTATVAPTDTTVPTETATATHTPAAAVAGTATLSATLVPQVTEGDDSGGGRVPLEAIVGGILLAAIIGYVALYLRGVAAMNRYNDGFVIEQCPACRRGHLTVENRQSRLFGIPRPRRIVRCDVCRSVLRETGDQRWRYAIDPVVNAALYERYNGREIDEADLVKLAQQPIVPDSSPKPPVEPPTFIEHDDQ